MEPVARREANPHEDPLPAPEEPQFAEGRMDHRLHPAAVHRQRAVRDHRADRRRQVDAARRHLPRALPPDAAPEDDLGRRQRHHDTAHRRLPGRGRVRGQGCCLPRLLEPAPRPRQGRRRAAGAQGGAGHRQRHHPQHADQRQAETRRRDHRPRFPALHQIDAARPGRLRGVFERQRQRARRTARRADR